MPDLQSLATTFRAGNYRFTGHVATIPYAAVLTGTVSATPSFPAITVAYTLDSGSTSDVRLDMLVVFFDSTGRRKGQTRIAISSETPISSTSLPIGETSAGSINIVSGDTFIVYDAVLILDKLVAANNRLDKDSRILISDNGTNPPPVANGGGAWAGEVDDGETYATVTFSAANSFTVDPDSSGTLTYLWDVDDGTITVGTTTTQDITVQFPQGFRHVVLTVTDSDNSKTNTKLIPVLVYDADNPALPVQMQSLSGDVRNGWQAEFETPAETGATLNDIPDGSLIIYFEKERYGATSASYGSNNAGRSHIKFVGYLVRDNTEINAEDNTLTFSAESPLMLLDKTAALPQYIKNKSNANKWRFLKSLSVNRILWYLLYWHSSVLTYFDFIWYDGTDLAYREIAVRETGSIGAQMRDVSQSINTSLTCDRQGVFRVIRNPNQLTIAERSSRTTTYDFTTADMVRVDFEREHRGSVKLVTAGGITAGTAKRDANSVFSKAPGTAPNGGTSTIEKNDFIVENPGGQDAINQIAGLMYAEENGLYYGQFVPQGLNLELPDGYDVFDPAYQEFLTLDLPATTNKRGVSFADTERWVLERVGISYDPDTGGKDVTLTLNHETFGVDGVTFVKPQPAQSKLPSFQSFDLQFGQLPVVTYPAPTPPVGTGTLALVDSSNSRFIRTDNFNNPSWTGGPTYDTVISVTGSISGTWIDWEADPYSPGYIGTGTAVNGWLATSTGIYRIADLFGTCTATLQHTFAAAVAVSGTGVFNRRVLKSTRAVQNFVACASYYTPGGISVATTTDGSSWTEVNVTTDYNNTPTAFANVQPAIYVSEHTAQQSAGRIYVGAFTSTGSAPSSALYRSTDYGATWSQWSGRMTGSIFAGQFFEFPYQNNELDNVFYWTNATSGSTRTLVRTTGTTQTNLDPNPTANTSGVQIDGMSSSPVNRLRMLVSYSRIAGGIGSVGVASTQDGGNTWVNLVDEVTTNRWNRVFMADDTAAYLLGDGTNRIGYLDNIITGTIDNRTGNLGLGTYIAIVGGGA